LIYASSHALAETTGQVNRILDCAVSTLLMALQHIVEFLGDYKNAIYRYKEELAGAEKIIVRGIELLSYLGIP